MSEEQQTHEEHNENVQDPQPIYEPMDEERKNEMLDEFDELIEIGEEFVSVRNKFNERWKEFLQTYSGELASDEEAKQMNQRAIEMYNKLFNNEGE
jgi:coenzyme F420-reducing hydrogenase alpha subunit